MKKSNDFFVRIGVKDITGFTEVLFIWIMQLNGILEFCAKNYIDHSYPGKNLLLMQEKVLPGSPYASALIMNSEPVVNFYLY